MRTYPKHNAAKRAIQIPYDLPGRDQFLKLKQLLMRLFAPLL